jgi:hypothetical protein
MMSNIDAVIDILGWLGAAAVLLAYLLVSAKRVTADRTSYQLLNLVGSLFLIVNTMHYRAYPSAFVNVVWLGIAAYATAKYTVIQRFK